MDKPAGLRVVTRRSGLMGLSAHQALAFSLSHPPFPVPLGSKGEHVRHGSILLAQKDVQPLPPSKARATVCLGVRPS